jgi:hypothetical protein
MYYDMNPRIEQHAMRTHRHRGAAFSWLHVPLTGAVLSLGAGMTEVHRARATARGTVLALSARRCGHAKLLEGVADSHTDRRAVWIACGSFRQVRHALGRCSKRLCGP